MGWRKKIAIVCTLWVVELQEIHEHQPAAPSHHSIITTSRLLSSQQRVQHMRLLLGGKHTDRLRRLPGCKKRTGQLAYLRLCEGG